MDTLKIGFIMVSVLMTTAAFASKSLIDSGRGTVLDLSTGLEWNPRYEGPLSFGEAYNFCENLVLANKSDWRLPTIRELESLYDTDKIDGVDRNLFDPGSSGYNAHLWSSTVSVAHLGNSIRWVMLKKGVAWTSDTLNVGNSSSVRCVRIAYK